MNNPRDLLVSWLHEPPDKALGLGDEPSRAARYLSAALGTEVHAEELQVHGADERMTAAERLPVPRWEARDGATIVHADRLQIIHPLSAVPHDACGMTLPDRVDEAACARAVAELVDGVESMSDRFWLLWRYLPEAFERIVPGSSLLPADSRIPDHTIWQHLDTTAALELAFSSESAPAFLGFSVGPVQSFIASARSVRDLWTGSMILSWLSFRAMSPLLESFGPAALIYPDLRGNPLLDLWLQNHTTLGERIASPTEAQRKTPCLPNRFVALVPGHEAGRWGARVEGAAAEAWQEICHAVHDALDPMLRPLDPQWDRHWNGPLEHLFEFRSNVLPWGEAGDVELARLLRQADRFETAFPAAAAVRSLADAIPETDRPPQMGRVVGQWQHRLELAARIADADRAFRETPPGADETGPVPAMCSLTGATEQVGPPILREAADFWARAAESVHLGGVRIRPGERLGPVALVKRFAGPAFFVGALGLHDPRKLRFDDTATIAAASWLEIARSAKTPLDDRKWRREGDWSGQWLHRADAGREDDEPCPPELAGAIASVKKELGAPPTYYALIMADGDHLGEWLSGRRSPPVRDLMHPQLREYFESQAGDAAGLQQPRPVTPAFHASLSRALANFSLHFVPPLIDEARGNLIYAGGDDVLALMPTTSALQCAQQLNDVYRHEWRADPQSKAWRLLMGRRATMSAGIVIAHHKSDLRRTLEQARAAEREAKQHGRDTVWITAARRSGEATSALCPWPYVPTVAAWMQAFQQGASDRWAYHLRAQLDTLRALPRDAARALVRRQIERAEPETRSKLGGTDTLMAQLDDYLKQTRNRLSPGESIEHFVLLSQIASFMARGTDR